MNDVYLILTQFHNRNIQVISQTEDLVQRYGNPQLLSDTKLHVDHYRNLSNLVDLHNRETILPNPILLCKHIHLIIVSRAEAQFSSRNRSRPLDRVANGYSQIYRYKLVCNPK